MSELKAGRELDALVAVKVMGWMRISVNGEERWGNVNSPHHSGSAPSNVRLVSAWNPSTDIAAAWEVVEALLARGVYPDLISSGKAPERWTCECDWYVDPDFNDDTPPVAAYAETAPLAIGARCWQEAGHRGACILSDHPPASPVVGSETAPSEDVKRCDRCGWPLHERIEDGCTEGNCSQRPLPPIRAAAPLPTPRREITAEEIDSIIDTSHWPVEYSPDYLPTPGEPDFEKLVRECRRAPTLSTVSLSEPEAALLTAIRSLEKERDAAEEAGYADGKIIAELVRQNESLRSELAAAKQDTDRLDGLEAMGGITGLGHTPTPGWYIIGPNGIRVEGHSTIREAIDAVSEGSSNG